MISVSMAFITSLPRYGGGEKWMLQAAEAMADRGHRVCLIGRPGGEVTRRAYALGLTVYPVRMGGWIDPLTLWELGRVLHREQVQVACVNVDKEIRQAALAGQGLRGLRIVPRRGSPDPIKDNWHYRFVYERLVDRLMVNCRALEEAVCGQAPWFDRTKVRVVYNGVDVDALSASARPGQLRAELGLDPDRPVVSLIGEVGWRKGQEILLRAAARLRREHPRAVFLIVGAGEYGAGEAGGRGDAPPGGTSESAAVTDEAGLRELSQRLCLDDGAVRFLGFRDDIPDVMADTDVLVLPSRREGFPNALLEGMALGLPVVATPVDGIPELVADGETGALTAVDDVDTFAAALGGLLADPDRRRAWGEAGRRRVREEFSAAMMFDAVEECLATWS